MFRLYQLGFCSIGKVVFVQCEQELMLCCSAEIVLKAFPVWTEALSVIKFATLPFDLKRSFTKMRFHCNFCSDTDGIQTVWKNYLIQNIALSTAEQGSTVPEQKMLWKQNSQCEKKPSIQYTFCDAPFHYPVHCEHSLRVSILHDLNFWFCLCIFMSGYVVAPHLKSMTDWLTVPQLLFKENRFFYTEGCYKVVIVWFQRLEKLIRMSIKLSHVLKWIFLGLHTWASI